jgi:EmrB/QacA subfamily drug resistance transporter
VASAPEGATPRISERQKRLALVAAILGSTVVGVDATVANVALPSISEDLGGGLAGQQWVANAYLITLASLILVGGSLGDLFGERRVFVAGVSGFAVTSVLCAVAPTIEVLIAARALQGISGALLTPAALAIIVAVFTPEERGGAIGSWTAWGGMGMLVGPLLGGYIVDQFSWRWIFALGVPIAALALAATASAVPDRRPGADVHPRLDGVGGLLCVLGLAGPTFALTQQPAFGWSSPAVWAPGLAGLALFTAFVLYEARSSKPMLELGLFRRRNFAVGNLQTLAMYGGLSILGFFLTLFLQQVAGYPAVKAGAVMLVPTSVMFVLSRRFGALADRYGPKWFMSVGPLFTAAGFLLRLDVTVSFLGDLLPALLVFSLGLASPSPRSPPRCSRTPTSTTRAWRRASTTRSPVRRACSQRRRWAPWWPRPSQEPSTTGSPLGRCRRRPERRWRRRSSGRSTASI